MERIVHVVGRNGVEYDMPMTAEQVAFFLRLAQLKSPDDIAKTFSELVALKCDQEEQDKAARLN